ncbi:MAG: histidine kinase [Marinifilaceae bacterium]|jgi:LytS/YehU family sensor histidine kinase|nr:histidine kinase [Marinifilaceae bacterium]
MIKKKRSYDEYIVWSILAIFYFFFGINHSLRMAISNSITITLGQIIIVKFNELYLMKKYGNNLKSKKYLIYSISAIILLSIIIVAIEHFTYVYILRIEELTKRLSKHPSYIIFPLIFNSISFGLAFFISVSLKLSKKEKENEIRIKNLEKSKIETELKFLKTQINPHFLFNALNNIYAITYKGDSQAPDKILDLSDMLRYVLYECKSDRVQLQKEIDYIKHYIKFQQLKTKETQNIILKTNTINSNCKIAPMLLIPFVENSFKHSNISKEKFGFVRIEINQYKNSIAVNIENSIPHSPIAKMHDNSSGIGLENVKKRLELIYPDNHILNYSKQNNKFVVNLKINTNG